jgi:transcription initiation factor IIE alpha subunit
VRQFCGHQASLIGVLQFTPERKQQEVVGTYRPRAFGGTLLVSTPATSNMSQSMRRLVQAVTRAFYADEHVVVMEQLLENRYFKDDPNNRLSLETYVNFQAKQVRHLLNELKEHGLVCSQELSEKAAEPGARLQKSVYWFINYRHFFKVVRYRLWLMQKQIDKMQKNDAMNQDIYKVWRTVAPNTSMLLV